MDASAALLALVMNLYHEARGEGPEGMRAVADTVYTRVHDERWPSSYTEVILQDKQFSWVKEQGVKTPEDLITLQGRVLHSKRMAPRDLLAYKQATKIAKEVLSEGYKPKYKFTHFHTHKISPYWSFGKRKRVIGRHLFMRF